ncbi:MAG TPA: cellulase family glycosylhydrolase, partial [Rhodocyclaceae bacterium]|nr:cellulase family glycosylhydrolase [Rhodocyclaceae bacterium]
MRTLAVLFLRLASLVLFATDVRATCIDAPVLTGVNLAGAEFNADKLPGVLNKDYVYPSAADLQYFASLGINTVRLPILWERVQPKLDSPLDDAQLASIAATIALAKHLNLCVILDV